MKLQTQGSALTERRITPNGNILDLSGESDDSYSYKYSDEKSPRHVNLTERNENKILDVDEIEN